MKHINTFNQFLNEAKQIDINTINKNKSINDMDYFQKAVIKMRSNNRDLSLLAKHVSNKAYYVNRLGEVLNPKGQTLKPFYSDSAQAGSRKKVINPSKKVIYANTSLDNVPFIRIYISNKPYKINVLQMVADTFPDMFLDEGTSFNKNYAYQFINPKAPNNGFIKKNIVYREKTRTELFADNPKQRFIFKNPNGQTIYNEMEKDFLNGTSINIINKKYGVDIRTISDIFQLNSYRYVYAFKGMYTENKFESIKKAYDLMSDSQKDSYIRKLSKKYYFNEKGLKKKVTQEDALKAMLNVDLEQMKIRTSKKTDTSIQIINLVREDILKNDLKTMTKADIARKYYTSPMSVNRILKKL